MICTSKNKITIFFISILFCMEIKSNETLVFKFKISENLSGYHRNLCYNILIEGMTGASSILIKEILPNDMYVDPYQVSSNNRIFVDSLIDCEIPAYLASSHEVILCSVSKTGAHEVCMPVHFRYQVPHNCQIYGKSATVHMRVPTISLKKVDNYLSAVSEGCFKTNGSLIYHGNPNVQPLRFKIPVGCTDDFYLVLFSSASIILLSVAYLFLSLINANEAISPNIS